MTINTIFANGDFAELEVREDFAFVVRTLISHNQVSSFSVEAEEVTTADGFLAHLANPKEDLEAVSMLIEEVYLQRQAIDILLDRIFLPIAKEAFFLFYDNLVKLETALCEFVENWINEF